MKHKKIIAVISSLLMLTGMLSGTAFAAEDQILLDEPSSTSETLEDVEFSGEIPDLTPPQLFGSQGGSGDIQAYADTWYPASICTENEWLILYGTNKLRASQGIEPLSTFDKLQSTARVRAGELATSYSNVRPNGTANFTAFDDAGITVWNQGENRWTGSTSPTEILEQWFNSPLHLGNILEPDFNHMGVGQNDINWIQSYCGGRGCDGAASISVVNPPKRYCLPANSSIDDFGILLELQDSCGTSYMPLIEEMCSNLDMNATGLQTVTVQCYGISTTIDVLIEKPWNFTDVPDSAWFYDNVYLAYNMDIMTGLNETTFGPSEPLGRGQFATILYRMDGTPEIAYQDIYPDVSDGKFYTSPAMWGKSTGVITGYANGSFGPADKITREQIATILYRYATVSKLDTSQRVDLSTFPDHTKVSSFSREALEWAVGVGIISGDNGNINPQGDASRAQCATMIVRFLDYYS